MPPSGEEVMRRWRQSSKTDIPPEKLGRARTSDELTVLGRRRRRVHGPKQVIQETHRCLSTGLGGKCAPVETHKKRLTAKNKVEAETTHPGQDVSDTGPETVLLTTRSGVNRVPLVMGETFSA